MKDVLTFLKSNNVAAIASSYKNIPYVSFVYYVIDNDLNFYFSTNRNTDKYLNFSKNPNVAIVVGTKTKKHIWVQAKGHAFFTKGKVKEEALKKLRVMIKKNNIKNYPLEKLEAFRSGKEGKDMVVVLKIIPQQMSFTNIDDDSFPKTISNKTHTVLPRKKVKKNKKNLKINFDKISA